MSDMDFRYWQFLVVIVYWCPVKTGMLSTLPLHCTDGQMTDVSDVAVEPDEAC